jgi:hypothetical protein
MRITGSVNERASAETLRYFVKPRSRSGLFVATVGGQLALGNQLCVYEMEEADDALTIPHTLRHRVLSRHLVADEAVPGRFAIEGCKVDIQTVFEGSPRKEEGFAEVDPGFVFELTPPPADQARMN